MKKLILGFALTLFLGTYTVSANFDNPPKKENAKTETASTEKKECTQATAEKKSCCQEKATASAEKKSCDKAKTAQTASTK